MLNEEKSICITELWEKKTNWDSWSKKFLLWGKWKGYKKLLVSNESTSDVDKIPTKDEYENTIELIKNLKIGWVKWTYNWRSKGTWKVIWNMLVSKYSVHTSSTLLKLKSEFHNGKLESMEKDPDQ